MMLPSKSRFLAAAAVLGLSALTVALPSSAHAWWRGGVVVGIPGPFVVGPPVAYPPPYAPPPVYAPPSATTETPPSGYQEAPDAYAEPPPGYQEPPEAYEAPQRYPAPYEQAPGADEQSGATAQSCFAGRYVCPLEATVPVGGNCWCPRNRGGREWGHAG